MRIPRLVLALGGLCAVALAVGGVVIATAGHRLSEPPAQSTRALETGPSGLPLPRFVSLKSDSVNVRTGPGRDHEIAWAFTRSGWPIEIVAEYDNWRRIRDSEGAEGWVFHALLSGVRTALVIPWSPRETVTLHRDPDPESAVQAYLEAGVMVEVDTCDGNWCRITIERRSGHIEQDRLWGVYPDERVE